METFLYKLELVRIEGQRRDLSKTKKEVVSILGLSERDKDRLLNSQTRLVKNSLDFSQAMQYQKALERSGIKCHIFRDVLNDYDMDHPKTISPADHLAVKVISTVSCAKCHSEQSEDAVKCGYCGFQIKKPVRTAKIKQPDTGHVTNQRADKRPAGPNGIKRKKESNRSRNPVDSRPVPRVSPLAEGESERAYIKKLFLKSRKIKTNMVKVAIMLGLTILLCAGFLYFCQLLWFMYQTTPVGHYYVTHYTQQAAVINRILDRNFLLFSTYISISALVACLITGAVTQFLFIQRYLFRSMGIIGKLILWVPPLTALVAYYLQVVYFQDSWPTVLVYSFIPTICLFVHCFDFIELLIPELSDVFRFLGDMKDKVIGLIHRGY